MKFNPNFNATIWRWISQIVA